MNPIWTALQTLARALGRPVAAGDLAARVPPMPGSMLPEVASAALSEYGFRVRIRDSLTVEVLLHEGAFPVLLEAKDHGGWIVWLAAPDSGGKVPVEVHSPGSAPTLEHWTLDHLADEYEGVVLQATSSVTAQAEHAGDSPEQPAHWFWSVFKRLRGHYGDCAVAAVLVNLLALAGSIFSMNVYDRIVPNAATHSLWVLAIGVALAALLEFGLRMLRTHILDDAGKQADLALSSAILRRLLHLRPQDRPASSAMLAAQVREFESVREFVSSTTLVTLSDLPFVGIFLVAIAFIGGPLAAVPMVVGALIVGVCLATQWPIRRVVERYQYENAHKLGLLVESLERVETIEALGAAPSVLGRWERSCAVAARSAMQSRQVAAWAMNATQTLQQLGNTALIVCGVYMILEGHLSTGALIGCTILSGRVLGSLAQVAGLAARWQQTSQAFSSVDRLMQLPAGDRPRLNTVSPPAADGSLVLSELSFCYPHSEQRVLQVSRLTLRPGEVTALLGPVGSGKSTLLRVLAGLLSAPDAQLLWQGIEVRQIAASHWRSQVAWLGQEPVLFRASLRENLLLAAPEVDDGRLLQVLQRCGLDGLVAQHPMGLDMPLGESGGGLSGGQRQLVALARSLLGGARILLWDEPTGSLDMIGEQQLLQRLRPELEGRLVVIATHRPAPLELASRVVLMDRGRVVADGPRDVVLQQVREGRVERSRPPAQEVSK